MLLSTQQNILLKEALKMRSVNSNLELEARITRETRYYTADQFCKLSEFLQNNQAFERKEMDEVLDIKIYASNKKDNRSIRYTITGLDSIRNYCRTERLTEGEYKKNYKDRIEWSKEALAEFSKQRINERDISNNSVVITAPDFNVRFNLKNEIDSNENNEFTDRIAQEEDKQLEQIFENQGYESQYKLFRFKKRVSYISFDKLFRIDLTIVKTNKKTISSSGRETVIPAKSFKESACLSQKEDYEIEIEMIGIPKTFEIGLERYNEIASFIISYLYTKTFIPISNSLSKNVITEYASIIKLMLKKYTSHELEQISQIMKLPEQDRKAGPFSMYTNHRERLISNNDIQESLSRTLSMLQHNSGFYHYDVNSNQKPLSLFFGPKVVSMEIENIQEKSHRTILNDYTVTDKADGETMLLFTIPSIGVYLIDTNMNVHILSNKPIPELGYSLLIGEFIESDKPRFLIFDTYLSNITEKGDINKYDIRLLPLISDNKETRTRISTASEIVSSIIKLPLNIDIFVKRFYIANASTSIFALSKLIWDNRSDKEKYNYLLDGLIFTPINMPAGFDKSRHDWGTQIGARWYHNMKWKPPSQNTIDFLVRIEKETIEVDGEKRIVMDKDKIRYKTVMNGNTMEFIPYKTIELYSGFKVSYSGNPCLKLKGPTLSKDTNKYIPTKFTPTNPPDELAFKAHIICDENKNNNIFSIHDSQRISDNTIVEFAYDIEKSGVSVEERGFRWIPLKTRVDKTESFNTVLKEKERLFNLLKEYTKPEINTKFNRLQEEDIMSLKIIINKFKLADKRSYGNAREIFDILNQPSNLRLLNQLITKPLDIPIKISIGNDFEIANAIWRSIHQPLTEDMITTGAGIPTELSTESLYYNRDINALRERSITIPLQEFHNKYVKNIELIGKAVLLIRAKNTSGYQIKLLDLACGKAGDLYKWSENKVDVVVGIDINGNNIYDVRDGACVRYNDFRKKMETFEGAHIPKVRFLNGDISKNIKNGTAVLDDERSIESRDQIWREIGNNYFDIVSIQFAIHYLFENIEKLNGLLLNISDNIKTGGLVIGCCFDGSNIYNKKENADNMFGKPKGYSISGQKDGDIIWKIKKDYEDIDESGVLPNSENSSGLEIDVFVKSIGSYNREYLVNFDYLTSKMNEYGFDLLESTMFSQIYSTHRDTSGFKELSDDEKRLSFINRMFIFRKR